MDTDAPIEACRQKVFWTMIVPMATLAIAQVVDPMTFQQIVALPDIARDTIIYLNFHIILCCHLSPFSDTYTSPISNFQEITVDLKAEAALLVPPRHTGQVV